MGLILVAGAGCAGMGGAPTHTVPVVRLSRAQFVRAADRACAVDHRRESKLGTPKTLGEFTKYLRIAVPELEHMLISLRGLTPPRDDAHDFHRLVASFDAEDFAAHDALNAINDRQEHPLQVAGRKLDVIGKRIHLRARKLGLTACVKAG
jgi:hypothetical protein